jgi:hypothetical protein
LKVREVVFPEEFCYAFRMETMGNNQQNSGWTTTAAAAKALNVSPRTVRLYIERGELSGKLEEGTDKRVWLVSIDSINTLRAKRGTSGISAETIPDVAETVPEAMRDLALRLESRAAEAAELRTRLELTTQTQSTIEQERDQLRADLTQAQEGAERLQAELEAERSKGFWQRLFRG